jgi:hypothetical protein
MLRIQQDSGNLLPPMKEVVWAYDEIADIVCLAARIPTSSVNNDKEDTFFWAVQKSYAYTDFNNITCDVEIEDFTPTHWAPLPKLPSKKIITRKILLQKAKSFLQPSPDWDKWDKKTHRYSYEDLEDAVCSVVEDIFINEISPLRQKSPGS